MKTQTTATVVDGMLKLDEPIDLPDDSRVRVTIEAVEESQRRWQDALDALEQLKQERPIHSGSRRYTRDELHERR
ncbi:MAG: hypothetical protein CMJ64_13635 [Planctomycetaceae bacterium]|nr:hypothetical protein [Planctomycetaceae bacterium]